MYPQYGPPPPGYYPPPQPMYPGPPPGMYGPPMMPIPGKATSEGVKYMSYYILLGIVTSLIGFFIALASLVTPAATVGLSCVVSGLGLLMFLIFIVAMVKFWEGKLEFGPAHEQNLKRALIMFIIIIVMTGISMAAAVMIGVTMALSGGIAQALLTIILISAGIGIVNAILWGLIELSLIRSFVTAEETSRAYMAIILMVVGQIVSIGITYFIFLTTSLITSGTSSYMTYIGGIFTILGNLMFYMIYKAVLMRFVTGQIKAPPPVMMGMPPGPMPPPGYGAPPGYQQMGPPPGYQQMGPPPPPYP